MAKAKFKPKGFGHWFFVTLTVLLVAPVVLGFAYQYAYREIYLSNLRSVNEDLYQETVARLEAEVAKIPASEFQENLTYYRNLQALNPDSERYVQKVKHYEQQLAQAEKQMVPATSQTELKTASSEAPKSPDPAKYSVSDFYWGKDSEPYKAQIVEVVNKIVRENKNCETVDTGTVMKSPSKSKPNDPVFFVTCMQGSKPFNVWFRPNDAIGSDKFLAKQPIDQGNAVIACEQAARNAANHPSTVDFSRFMDMAYTTYPSGRARVRSSFTAKNALNLETTFDIDCLFDGSALIETNISEKTN